MNLTQFSNPSWYMSPLPENSLRVVALPTGWTTLRMQRRVLFGQSLPHLAQLFEQMVNGNQDVSDRYYHTTRLLGLGYRVYDGPD
jgi:hypothetical protein